jgi:hypothetical protein
MPDTTEDLGAKLLEILNQPEQSAELVDAIEKTVDKDEGNLTDAQRATLGSLLNAGLPTPEEILRDAKIMEHNDKLELTRRVKLALRKQRRVKRGALGRKR